MSFRATHLANEGEPLCRTRMTNFASKLQLTADPTRVTCDRCLRKRGKLERLAKQIGNDSVSGGSDERI